MSLITRTYTFSDGTTAYGSQVESEIANLANTINNLDAGTTTWDIVKAVNSASTPLIADNSTGSNTIFEARANGVAKVTVGSAGLLTAVAGATISGASLTMSGQTIAMGSNKITGLSNGTAATDAAAYGQLKVIQYVSATTTTNTSLTSSTFTAVGGLSASITPSATTSKVKITVTGNISMPASTSVNSYVTITRGGTNLGSSVGFTQGRNNSATTQLTVPCHITCIDSPSSTSSLTYDVRMASSDNASTSQWNQFNQTAVIILEELA